MEFALYNHEGKFDRPVALNPSHYYWWATAGEDWDGTYYEQIEGRELFTQAREQGWLLIGITDDPDFQGRSLLQFRKPDGLFVYADVVEIIE